MAQSSSGLNPAQLLNLVLALSREGDTNAYRQSETADREAARRDREAEMANTDAYRRLDLEMRQQAERDRQRLEGWNVYNAQLGRQQQMLRDLETAQRNAFNEERERYSAILSGLPKEGGFKTDKLASLTGELNLIEQQVKQDIINGALTAGTSPAEYLASLGPAYKTAQGNPYNPILGRYLPSAIEGVTHALAVKGVDPRKDADTILAAIFGMPDKPAEGSVMAQVAGLGGSVDPLRDWAVQSLRDLKPEVMGDPAAIKAAREAVEAMQRNPEGWVAAHMGMGGPSGEAGDASAPTAPAPHQVRVAGTISDSAGHHYAIPLAQEGSEQLIGPIQQGLVGSAGDERAIQDYNDRGGGSLKPGDLLPQQSPTEAQTHNAAGHAENPHDPAFIQRTADIGKQVVEAGEKAFGGNIGQMGQPVPGKPGYIYGDPGMGGGIVKAPDKVSLAPHDLLEDAGSRIFEGPHREEIAANLKAMSPEQKQHFVHTVALWHSLAPEAVAKGLQGLIGDETA